MANEVGVAYLSFLPSFKGFKEHVLAEGTKASESGGSESGRHFGELYTKAALGPLRAFGGAALGLLAVDRLKDFVGESIKLAQESNRADAITAQAIRSTGGAARVTAEDVRGLAESLSAKTGMDRVAVQSGANLLLTFTNVRNEVGRGNDIFNQATTAVTDMSAALGQDTKSSAIELGKALNDPIRGVTALQRVGVSFTKSQREQIKGLVEHGHALAAQKIILHELGREFGGAAAAAATPLDKMRVAITRVREGLGNALLPVLTRFTSFVLVTAIPGIEKIVKVFHDAFAAIVSGNANNVGQVLARAFGGGADAASKVTRVARFVIDGLKDLRIFVVSSLLPSMQRIGVVLFPVFRSVAALVGGAILLAFRALAGILKNTVGPALVSVSKFFASHKTLIQSVAVAIIAIVAAYKAFQLAMAIARGAVLAYTAVQWLLNVAMDANPIGIIVLALVALAAALVWAWTHSATFRNIVIGVWNAVRNFVVGAVTAVRNFVVGAWQWIYSHVMAAVNGYRALIVFAFNFVRAYIIAWISTVRAIWHAVWNWIVDRVRQGVANFMAIIHTIATVWGWIIAGFERVRAEIVAKFQAVISFFAGVPGRILSFFTGLESKMLDIGSGIVHGILNGLQNGWHYVTDGLQTLIGKIPKAIRSFLHIGSPSKLMADLFYHVPEGAAVGIQSGVALVAAAAATMANAAVPALVGGTTTSTAAPSSATSAAGRYAGMNLHVYTNAPTTDGALRDAFSRLDALYAGTG